MNKTKNIIFEAAIKVFSQSGYDSATMDEMAKEAGVAKGTLYYHFKSKEELFYFVVQRGIDLIKEDLEQTMNSITDPVERIKAISRLQLEYVYDNKDLFRVIVSHLWGKKDQHDEIRQQIESLMEINSRILEDDPNSGNDKGNHEIFGYYFIGVLFSSVLYEIIKGENENHSEVIDKFINYTSYGLNCNKSNT